MTTWQPQRPCPIPGHPQEPTAGAPPAAAPEGTWQKLAAWHLRAPAERLPLPVVLTTWPAAWVMNELHVPGYIPGCATCAAAGVSWLAWWWRGKRSEHPRVSALEAAAVVGVAGAWVTAADIWGPLGWPGHLLSWVYVAGSAAGYAWLRSHQAVRAARQRREAEAAMRALKREWHQILARLGLHGWHVQEYRETNLGYQVLITTSPENESATRVASRRGAVAEKLAHILGLPYGRIDLGLTDLPGELLIDVRTSDVSVRAAAYHPMTTPWPDAGPSPFAAWFPATASIRDLAVWGFTPEDGSPLGVRLLSELGGRVIGVIGATGSGKSSLLNNLREFVSRCPDARMVQLNGAHMGDELTWEPLSALTVCGPVATDPEVCDKIARALRALCLLVTNRSATLATTGHSTFQPTAKDPAVVIFADEVDQIVKYVRGAREALEFLASKQRKSAVCLVPATQRATVAALGGGQVRANMGEVLVGNVARSSESRHATGAETEIPDIREYSKGKPGYFQGFDPNAGTVTGRGRAFLLGKPPEELAYIGRLVANRKGWRDWSIPDLPPLGGEEAADGSAAEEVSGLRARLASIARTAPEPADDGDADDPAWERMLRLLAKPEGTTASELGDAIGVSKTTAFTNYLDPARSEGVARLDGSGAGARWRLAVLAAPGERQGLVLVPRDADDQAGDAP